MPLLTRWYIKTSFVYFILATLLGVFLGVQAVWSIGSFSGVYSPVYFHLLAEGWITMLIIGVAFWMFPKMSLEKPRGSELAGWISYILLNAGLLLRIISEPINVSRSSTTLAWGILLSIAAVLQWLGGMAFVLNSWGRVKEK